ncbi:MAG: SH3 domain-containing protein [Chloroflexota bacterium]|nr:SH3 domain-containing protein [Chloroflexota bacterium]
MRARQFWHTRWFHEYKWMLLAVIIVFALGISLFVGRPKTPTEIARNATETMTVTVTASSTLTPTPRPTDTPTATSTLTPTNTPTLPPTITPTITPTPRPQFVVWVKGGVQANFRDQAGVKSNVLIKLSNGVIVEGLGKQETIGGRDWYKVLSAATDARPAGWIAASMLYPAPSEAVRAVESENGANLRVKANSRVIEWLGDGTVVIPTGETQDVGSIIWVEVETLDEQTGWIADTHLSRPKMLTSESEQNNILCNNYLGWIASTLDDTSLPIQMGDYDVYANNTLKLNMVSAGIFSSSEVDVFGGTVVVDEVTGYLLNPVGELIEVLVSVGAQLPDGEYVAFVDGLTNYHDLKVLLQRGVPFSASISSSFVSYNNVDWQQCSNTNYAPLICRTGVELERRYPDADAVLLSGERMPPGAILFGWGIETLADGQKVELPMCQYISPSDNAENNTDTECGAMNFPHDGPHYVLGETPFIELYAYTTGDVKTVTFHDAEIDLARVYSASKDEELQDNLWVATGVTYSDGTYQAMNVNDHWTSHAEAVAEFERPCQQIHLSVFGFIHGGQQLAWEDCPAWQAFNPDNICELGLDLKMDAKGRSTEFIKTGLIPYEDWFLFGWSIEL